LTGTVAKTIGINGKPEVDDNTSKLRCNNWPGPKASLNEWHRNSGLLVWSRAPRRMVR